MHKLLLEFAIRYIQASLNEVIHAQVTIDSKSDQLTIYDLRNGTTYFDNPAAASDQFSPPLD
jgi:hypothetical protein